MTTALASAVELLDRSLGYTRVVLAGVSADRLDRPTPCHHWDLCDLLAHVDDALDAFTEAAGGEVVLPPPSRDELRVERLQLKACALLGVWSRPVGDGAGVTIGDRALAPELLVGAAALEIAVHGWDVGQAVAGGPGVPDDLADQLLPLAHRLVHDADRGVHFAQARPALPHASPGARLLAFLGRG